MRRLAAITLGLAFLSCGGNAEECTKPADCFTQPQASTCLLIGGRHRCVTGCASGVASTCPSGLACNGMSEDGKAYCTTSPSSGSPDAR